MLISKNTIKFTALGLIFYREGLSLSDLVLEYDIKTTVPVVHCYKAFQY